MNPVPSLNRNRLRNRLGLATATVVLSALLGACAVPVQRTTRVFEVAPAGPPVFYARYGNVQRIEVVDIRAEPTGGGALIGGVVGGVVGNQFGRGGGRAAATVLGAFGGALIGNQAEQNQAAAESGRLFHVFVRFDDGHIRRFDYSSLNGLRTGERVRFEAGVLDRA